MKETDAPKARLLRLTDFTREELERIATGGSDVFIAHWGKLIAVAVPARTKAQLNAKRGELASRGLCPSGNAIQYRAVELFLDTLSDDLSLVMARPNWSVFVTDGTNGRFGIISLVRNIEGVLVKKAVDRGEIVLEAGPPETWRTVEELLAERVAGSSE